MDIIQQIIQELLDNWTKVAGAAIVLAVASLVTWWKSRREWKLKQFYSRVNFSLCTFSNAGVLKIRTLTEKRAEDIFLNETQAKNAVKAARRGNSDILDLPLEDYWLYLNDALNELSERFADGFIVRDIIGTHGVLTERYCMALTCERDGAVNTRKIRVVIIAAHELSDIRQGSQMPLFESKWHTYRWKLLQQMAAEMEGERVMEFELCVPRPNVE